VDILRGVHGATIVAQMPFPDAKGWSDAILQETLKDLKMISLYDPQTQSAIPVKPTSQQFN